MSLSLNKTNSIILNKGYTDLLKFQSAILVAFGHYSVLAYEFTGYCFYNTVTQFAGYVGVAIFFFLSGYGLMMSERKSHLELWPFMKKRLAKVYLPVVFVTLVWQIILWPQGAGINRLPYALYSIIWGFSDGILWFVKVILACYAMFRIYLMINKHLGGARLLFLIVITGALYAMVYVLGEDWEAISIPLFSLGIVVAEDNKKICTLIKGWNCIIILAVLTAVFILLWHFCGLLYIHALINWYVVIALLLISSVFVIDINLPNWIGGVSYDIYLTHNKIIEYLRPVYGFIGLHHFIIGVLIASTASYTLRRLLKI